MGRPKGSVNKKSGKVPAWIRQKIHRKNKRDSDRLLTRTKKDVKTLQSYDFGVSADSNHCYRVEVITIKEEPYIGFIKCWRGPSRASFSYTRQRLFMPMSAWMHFKNDALPLLNCTPTHDRYLFLVTIELNMYSAELTIICYINARINRLSNILKFKSEFSFQVIKIIFS